MLSIYFTGKFNTGFGSKDSSFDQKTQELTYCTSRSILLILIDKDDFEFFISAR